MRVRVRVCGCDEVCCENDKVCGCVITKRQFAIAQPHHFCLSAGFVAAYITVTTVEHNTCADNTWMYTHTHTHTQREREKDARQ